MKKYIFIFGILCSFSAIAQTSNELKNGAKDIGDFTFFDPVYNHKNQIRFKTRYDIFEKYTTYSLDSLFSVDAKKYKIHEKLRYKKSKRSNEIETEIKGVFRFAKKNDNFKISPKLKSVISKTTNRYGLFMSINPVGDVSYYTRQSIIKKTSIEIIIFDLKKHKIVYYVKSKALRSFNVGHNRNLIKNLDYIYKKIEKL